MMLKYPLKLSNSFSTFRNVPVWLSQQIQIKHRHDDRNITKTLESFQNVVKKRQIQARNSIYVETKGDSKTLNELYAYCHSLGPIQNIFRNDVESNVYFLVEFSNSAAANEIIQSAFHSGNHMIDGKVRVKGRFLSFIPTGESTPKRPHNIKRELNVADQDAILRAMRTEKTTSNQIMKLYNVNKLSDLSSRLRFLTALQIEEALSGVFHNAQVLPFGSSINGFGRMQSDLDMIVLSCGNRTYKGQFNSIPLGKEENGARFVNRNNLYVMSSIARHWLQGVHDVVPILNARVPIIKYNHYLTNLECDLSMSNVSGYQMSEIFYTFGEIDERVRPLVFYIRAWAKEFEIIQTYPAQGLSNFMINCLVIFFLQQLPKPILPPSDDFSSMRDVNNDIHVTDISKLNFRTENTSTLAQLVLEFFEFYCSFDFNKNAASISDGSIRVNISTDSIYVYNPLDEITNITRNVTDFERNQFLEKCIISRDVLIKNNIDAVGLLELYRLNGMYRNKFDLFVNNMVKSNKVDKENKGNQDIKKIKEIKDNKENKQTSKFSVKSIMKTQ